MSEGVLEMNIKSRRQARETALQVLYQCDTLDDWSNAAVDLCLSRFFSDEQYSAVGDDGECQSYVTQLVNGVRDNLAVIERRISSASQNWSFGRMARVDRNILRIAAFEICFLDEIPGKVSINEAIEIARRFGSSETPAFVNGILDRIAGSLREAA